MYLTLIFFSTGSSLLDELNHRGFNATDTVMLNRIFAEVKLKIPSDKQLSATRRDSHVEFVREDDSLSLVKWLDKKGVILLFTVDSVEPTECCDCSSNTAEVYISVPWPALITTCNENRGK